MRRKVLVNYCVCKVSTEILLKRGGVVYGRSQNAKPWSVLL
jgi:hypothetical protein